MSLHSLLFFFTVFFPFVRRVIEFLKLDFSRGDVSEFFGEVTNPNHESKKGFRSGQSFVSCLNAIHGKPRVPKIQNKSISGSRKGLFAGPK